MTLDFEVNCDKALHGAQASYGDGFLTHPERPLPLRYVISASLDGTLRFWDTASGVCVRVDFGHDKGVWALAVDGLRVVMAKVWDIVTGDYVRTPTGHRAPVTCVALTDSVMATRGDDCMVVVSDFKSQ